ncbi:MAG: hypothetical protein ACK57Z_08225 [Akkermansiaceae bacterium]
MNSCSWQNFARLGIIFLVLNSHAVGQEDISDQPAPKAIPIENLLPKFDQNTVAISRSRQFKIKGSDPEMRAAAANLAEEIKDEMLRLLEEKDEWKVPVNVEMRGTYGDPVPLRKTVLKLKYNEVGYEVDIFVHLSRGLHKESYQRAVIEGCLLARSFKDAPKTDEKVPYSVSPWLVEGFAEAIAWRLGQSDRRMYDTLFRHGGLFELKNLFELDGAAYLALDAASKAAFRVSAGAMVMALSEQPDGKAGMRSFLKEASTYSGEIPTLLRQHFPELNLSQSSLSKWWALQLAIKGEVPLAEVMSVFVTDQELGRGLKIRYRNAEGGLDELPLLDWQRVPELTKAERMEAVRLTEDELVRLSLRCFPSFRPLLNEYQLILAKWVAGETKGLNDSLSKLSETRATMVSKSERARDYMDWFEITRARETSGEFNEYLTLKSRLKFQTIPRKDTVSKYLDRLDPLFVIPELRQPNLFPFK